MPNTGKKLKMPPSMSNIATASRAANDDGLRNQRMKSETLVGTRRLIISKYLFSSAFVAAIYFCRVVARGGLGRPITTLLIANVPARTPRSCSALRSNWNKFGLTTVNRTALRLGSGKVHKNQDAWNLNPGLSLDLIDFVQ